MTDQNAFDPILGVETAAALPLALVTQADYAAWLAEQLPATRAWLASQAFAAERGRVVHWPDAQGNAAGAVAGLGTLSAADTDLWFAALVAERLQRGDYRLIQELPGLAATQWVLGWRLAGYRYSRYRPQAAARHATARLVAPRTADLAYAAAASAAICLARDLVNTPANDMGPAELAAAAAALADRHGGACRIVQGQELTEGYPLIEAVGRGSPRAPRLVELRFDRPGAPRITLVGKGVCFDSGGLDIKPPAGMLLMKKDMGGAACVLGLTQMLRELDAPVALRVLIPAVENSVDGLAFRPGDVCPSRKGLSVEIGNTDAEGRLVLADALSAAGDEAPDLLIDMATLTGAARVALGADLPAMFSGDAGLLVDLQRAGERTRDPLWPLPLWEGYDDELSSRIADLNNVSASPLAGAITAALFLKRFVAEPQKWLHIDLYAWNPKDRPGRPAGGEGHTIRAVHDLIRSRFG